MTGTPGPVRTQPAEASFQQTHQLLRFKSAPLNPGHTPQTAPHTLAAGNRLWSNKISPTTPEHQIQESAMSTSDRDMVPLPRLDTHVFCKLIAEGGEVAIDGE